MTESSYAQHMLRRTKFNPKIRDMPIKATAAVTIGVGVILMHHHP
jgi:hypothetical protein